MATVLALAIAACGTLVGSGVRPGTSTRVEVESRWGKPAEVFTEPDGSQRLCYPLGPQGLQTYMVTVRPDGVVREVEQVLQPAYFDRIRRGFSTRDDVRRLLGPPYAVEPDPVERGFEIWTWRWSASELGNVPSHFYVRFNGLGQVVRTAKVAEVRPSSESE